MAKYVFADIIVEINNRFDYIPEQCKDYAYSGNEPAQISISVTDKEIENEFLGDDKNFSKGYIESICAYRKIAQKLPEFDAFVMHGAVFNLYDKGIAFLASSGTGKTTHLVFWKKMFKKSLTIINGDKPIIRFIDGVPYAYGTPWAGKEGLNTNARTVLTDLCFIERANHDEVVPLPNVLAPILLLKQIYRPSDPAAVDKTYALADKLLKFCNLRIIKCTKSPNAAETAYKAIFNK